MSEIEAHSDDPTGRCAVVLAHANDTGFIDQIESDDLSHSELTILRQRMRSHMWSPRRLFKLAKERNWPPLIFVRGRPPLIPPPCVQQFEPTPLNGADPTLHALADLLLEQADAALHKVLRHKQKWSEFAKVSLISTLVFLLQAVIIAIAYWNSKLTIPFGLIIPIAFAYAFAFAAVYFLCKRDWYIVPGGVVVRRTLTLGDSRPRVLSPANALLATGRRQVHIIDRNSGEIFRANLSRFEIMIFLAVWQSPIPAPDVSKLVDLQ